MLFVTGGSLVRKDVPPYVKAAREPTILCRVNSVGLRRRGLLPKKIIEVSKYLQNLYQKNYNNSASSANY